MEVRRAANVSAQVPAHVEVVRVGGEVSCATQPLVLRGAPMRAVNVPSRRTGRSSHGFNIKSKDELQRFRNGRTNARLEFSPKERKGRAVGPTQRA